MNTTTQPASELLLIDQCEDDIKISNVSVCGASLTLCTDSFPVESPEEIRFLVQEIRERILSVFIPRQRIPAFIA